MSAPVIRPAEPADVPEIFDLIRELAVYEREPDAVRTTAQRIHEQLFGDAPAVFAFVAEAPAGSQHRLAGMALWFLTFSTWEGEHGIHLEDLFVREELRGHGVGAALLQELAITAVERGYRRVEWAVLKWNEPAIGFYRRLGAAPMEEWDTYRLTGEALQQLGTVQQGPETRGTVQAQHPDPR